jgi:membrane protein required for colicin V production
MNWLDFFILVVLIAFTYSAYRTGLVRQVVTLFAIVLGIVLAGIFYDDLAADVLVFIDNEEAALVVSFLALFGAVYLLGQLAAYVLKSAVALLMLGWVDRLGGAVFGLIKGLVVLQVILILFAAYPQLSIEDAIDDSAIADVFLDDVPVVLGFLPGEFDDRVDRFLHPDPA